MKNELRTLPLNEVQLSLLRMFNRKMSYDECYEIRDVLVKYFSDKLFLEVDKIVIEKEITDVDYENLRHQHHRTKV